MKIFLIEREDYDYDENYAHVIICKSINQARLIASLSHCDEGSQVWNDKNKAKCKLISNYTGQNKKPFILSTSYNAG